ncbi:MAG: PilZ domain-containing protein [Bdellovibrionales bacterium]|nr:PilZ domain-containing protein [Bdellovibrionales bacterium]
MGENKTSPAPRLPLKMNVQFRRSYARQEIKGTLKNISLTGAFLEGSKENLTIGDKVSIRLTVGGRDRKVNAKVIWLHDSGCGVQFQPFNNRDIQIVDDLMYFVESSREGRRLVLDDIFGQVA